MGNIPSKPDDVLLVGYRDYLVKQWVDVKTLPEWTWTGKASVKCDRARILQELRWRFHQDFEVKDMGDRPVTEYLVAVLSDILTSANDEHYGLRNKLPDGQLPIQGSATTYNYLQSLITLSGVPATELSLRYRINFDRNPDTKTNPVKENISTLQSFFRDQFHCVRDPKATYPVIDPDVPLVFPPLHGLPPFFLQYEEWLTQYGPFYPEIQYQIGQVFNPEISPRTVNNPGTMGYLYSWTVRSNLEVINSETNPDSKYDMQKIKRYVAAYSIQDRISEALKKSYQLQNKTALEMFLSLENDMDWIFDVDVFHDWNKGTILGVDVIERLAQRASLSVQSPEDLQIFMDYCKVPDDCDGPPDTLSWIDRHWESLAMSLVMVRLWVLPLMISKVCLDLGDFTGALERAYRPARVVMGKAKITDKDAYDSQTRLSGYQGLLQPTFPIEGPHLWRDGDLPYGLDCSNGFEYLFIGKDKQDNTLHSDTVQNFFEKGLHQVELAFARLQLGNAMLEWADKIYRQNDSSSVARARELYKGVLLLHGDIPPINPTWENPAPTPPDFSTSNSVLKAQIARARRGFIQIEAGMNYFGYSEDTVPTLRYATLKQAADSLATEAKATEADFIDAIERLETLTMDELKSSAMIQRGTMQAKVIAQQQGIAADQYKQAKVQVDRVKQAIAAKQAEIDDHDSFFGQLGDYVKGMVGLVKDTPDWIQKPLGSSIEAEFKGASDAAGGLAGMGTAATVTAGYGAFFAAAEITVSSAADAQNARSAQLLNLQNQDLVSALAQRDIAQRNATIADLNKQIADADVSFVKTLLNMQQGQLLNKEFWNTMAAMYRKILQQILEAATRTAWLAERALEYELDTDIGVMRLDYYHSAANSQGVGGADQLQLDLTTLTARYVENTQEALPVKWTVSLARDFPLEFSLLRNTGKCSIFTKEEVFQKLYPGTYGYRIVCVRATVNQVSAGTPMRGLITNNGCSRLSGSSATLKPLVRPADALLISDFNMETSDAMTYGLPGKTLMQFEGSGIETIWNVEFSDSGAPTGFASLADLLITFDMQARYSSILHANPPSPPYSGKVEKAIWISSRKQQNAGLLSIRDSSSTEAILSWKLPSLRKGMKRTINNVGFTVVGEDDNSHATVSSLKATVEVGGPIDTVPIPDIPAWDASTTYTEGFRVRYSGKVYSCRIPHTSLSNWDPAGTASLWNDLGPYEDVDVKAETRIPISFEGNIVFSNNPPVTDDKSKAVKSPLNVLGGEDASRGLFVRVVKSENLGVEFGKIKDLLLYLDYTEIPSL
ncbi:carbohydrate-binding module family 12 protein [Lepidopterella palustris CBS 459.81]|uniref:Carbohydrate-binding module family 12 protein n=1 Tax=Lepidopterella palustris CBS 459.81 TaxID=1314670 RepID=A0A8E2J966_9PEZI|nr:carbohydrate-binding module family 12 protein [Lepidopterella palustris CBS 459.81]